MVTDAPSVYRTLMVVDVGEVLLIARVEVGSWTGSTRQSEGSLHAAVPCHFPHMSQTKGAGGPSNPARHVTMHGSHPYLVHKHSDEVELALSTRRPQLTGSHHELRNTLPGAHVHVMFVPLVEVVVVVFDMDSSGSCDGDEDNDDDSDEEEEEEEGEGEGEEGGGVASVNEAFASKVLVADDAEGVVVVDVAVAVAVVVVVVVVVVVAAAVVVVAVAVVVVVVVVVVAAVVVVVTVVVVVVVAVMVAVVVVVVVRDPSNQHLDGLPCVCSTVKRGICCHKHCSMPIKLLFLTYSSSIAATTGTYLHSSSEMLLLSNTTRDRFAHEVMSGKRSKLPKLISNTCSIASENGNTFCSIVCDMLSTRRLSSPENIPNGRESMWL